MGNQLSLLNRHACGRVGLNGADLDCLELITRRGPLSPGSLARRAGLHPATVTGVVDRLERGGWVLRERDTDGSDRRAVAVRALKQRNAELVRPYSGMNAAMDHLCADYTESELELLADFFGRVTAAAEQAADDLTER